MKKYLLSLMLVNVLMLTSAEALTTAEKIAEFRKEMHANKAKLTARREAVKQKAISHRTHVRSYYESEQGTKERNAKIEAAASQKAHMNNIQNGLRAENKSDVSKKSSSHRASYKANEDQIKREKTANIEKIILYKEKLDVNDVNMK